MNDPVGFTIPFTVAVVAAPFQIRVGDTAARAIASQQPVKFASMEYVPYTTRGATEWLGGVWYHGARGDRDRHSRPGRRLAAGGFSPRTRVTGWSTVPPRLRPPRECDGGKATLASCVAALTAPVIVGRYPRHTGCAIPGNGPR